MHKKFFGMMLILACVLILTGASCSNKNIAKVKKQTSANPSANPCGATAEITAPNALARELKTIFNEAGGQVTLTANSQPESATGETLTFIWKKKPTMEKLESVFKKHGYTVEVSGETLIAKKGEIILSISLTEAIECQKIIVRKLDPALQANAKITDAECIETILYFRYASYLFTAKNDPFTSVIWSKKGYDKMDALGAKYGMTRDEVEVACQAKMKEPGFMDKVDKQGQESGLQTK